MEMPAVAEKAVLAVIAATITILALTGAVETQRVGATAAHSAVVAVASTVKAAPDACGLVTPQEVSAAFGGAAGPSHFVLNTCVYDNGSHELIVAMARNDAKAQFVAGRTSAAQSVAGIGDSAYTWNGRLAVLKGSSVMLLTLVPSPASGVSPAAMTLARAAVTRL
jgi:hypothetical protein